MLKVEIKSDEVKQRQFPSKKTGELLTFREQEGFVDLNGEHRRIVVSLQDNQRPYMAGAYALDGASFYVGQYGRLQLGRLHLRAIPASAAKAS